MPEQAERIRIAPPGDKKIIGVAFALFALLHAAPFLFTRIPPLVDLLGHMGRYAVQVNIGSSPQLQKNWSFHWAPVANMGFDVLIQLLSPFMGVERASWLLAALLAPFTIWGLGRVSHAVHGRLSPFLVLAAPFTMAFPFQMGFVKYCLSCALALHLFASWVDADKSGWGLGKRLLVFVPGSLAVWFCHAYGWGILAVMAGGYELVRVAQAPEGRRLAAARDHLCRLAAISIPALLLLFWRSGSNGVETKHFFDFALKFLSVAELLRDQIEPVDLISIGVALGVLLFILAGRQIRLNMELAVPAALLFLCELLLPFKLLGVRLRGPAVVADYFHGRAAGPGPRFDRPRGDTPDRDRRRAAGRDASWAHVGGLRAI
jgi:hypothetical protein